MEINFNAPLFVQWRIEFTLASLPRSSYDNIILTTNGSLISIIIPRIIIVQRDFEGWISDLDPRRIHIAGS